MSKKTPTLTDRLRDLLDRLEQWLNPHPKPLPQPIPVRTTRKQT